MSNTMYKELWEDFGTRKGDTYLGYKFLPTHRIAKNRYINGNIYYKDVTIKIELIALPFSNPIRYYLLKVQPKHLQAF